MNQDKDKQDKFLRLLEPNLARLEKFILVQTRNCDEAKDILSETILIAFEQFDEIRAETAFLSYLFTIASRIHKRKFVRKKFWGKFQEEKFSSIPDGKILPDDTAEIALLNDAIGKLPGKTRDAIIMHELLDMPLEEVQKIQGGSLSAVKVRLMRGRRKLAKMLGIKKNSEEKNSSEKREISFASNIQNR